MTPASTTPARILSRHALVAHVVADAERQGKRIIPTCPYVAKWLGKHPEHDEIVDAP